MTGGCYCADARLHGVIAHAKEYGIDPQKLVVAGDSAGGHLALTTAFLPASAGLDRQRPGGDDLNVSAVLTWYGIADVNELLDGPNRRSYAVTWLGSLTNRDEVARRVSPLTYVRRGLPPVLTIHGRCRSHCPLLAGAAAAEGADRCWSRQRAADHAGRKARIGLLQSRAANAYQAIQAFLQKHGVLTPATMSSRP